MNEAVQIVRSAAFYLYLLIALGSAGNRASAWTDDTAFGLSSDPFDAPLCVAQEPSLHAADACWPLSSEPLCSLPEFDAHWSATEQAQDENLAATRARAREDLERANALAQDGRLADALLHLRAVESALPRIADRIALMRAELLLDLGMPKEACAAYAIAVASPDRGVAARGEIGRVHCAITGGDRNGVQALEQLLRRYPNLPERHELRLELALWDLNAGKQREAALLLRRIDLEAPASSAAKRARQALESLRAGGMTLVPYTGIERVQRAERLFREGPLDEAQSEVEALSRETLTAEAHAKLYLLAARLARVQGRWDEAARATQQAHDRHAVLELDKPHPAPPPALTPEELAAERAALDKRIRALRGNRPTARLTIPQLRNLLDLSLQNSLKELCDEVLTALGTRKGVQPALRFESAMRASGLASDEQLAQLLATLLPVPTYRLSARYHYARALERMGRLPEAEAEYLRVIADDRGQTPYYAMWAGLRLSSVRSGPRANCVPGATGADGKSWAPAAGQPCPPPASLVAARFDRGAPAGANAKALASGELPRAAQRSEAAGSVERRRRALSLLAPIADGHAEAYPWLARASDLIELDRFEDAADELSEAYLAYRDASGAPRLRSGLVALLSGGAPPRRPMTPTLRRARRSLDLRARQTLSEVARVLGDPGIGLRFGNFRLDELPRAYPDVVEQAARKHGLDPNLLFAVMRVESIYNRRIISNAGAVGLMQIMPHTGLRIARQLGVQSFEVGDLLDPQLNVDFAAWYLKSLLQRFDGRLPLAIASYNGGPHNVRLWMKTNVANMPLDAFLERIPFTETHRYVRRVLTHYAAYRAQQNLPMTRLSVELPQPQPDTIAF